PGHSPHVHGGGRRGAGAGVPGPPAPLRWHGAAGHRRRYAVTHSADYEAPRTLTVGSLFSGIGGIDLGLERAGMRVIWQSEIDPYASKILAKHWPEVPNLGDIKKIEWSEVERPDVVAGGFPCQPVSAAGHKRAQEDPRWLWPEFARCLRELRPRFAILENVPALLTVASGAAAQEVFGDLALLGYDTEWDRLSAAEVGAPHLRNRIFVVAYPVGFGALVEPGRGGCERPEGLLPQREDPLLAGGHGEDRALAYAGSERRLGRPGGEGARGQAALGSEAGDHPGDGGESRGPGGWAPEPDVGRVADGVPSRVDRLRCLGNAVVPQVAEHVGRRLLLLIDGQEAG